MIGLSGIIENKCFSKLPEFIKEADIHYEKIEYNNIFIERRTLIKFLDDKIFLNTNSYIIVIEGVIFNKIDLIEKYASSTWELCIIEMYKKLGETFYNDFRGSFMGYFHDKRSVTSIIFTDHIGDKPIYFYKNSGEIVFSSSIKFVLRLFTINDLNYNLDIKAAYSLLTHGYMLEDLTPIEEIKRLKAGCYIKIFNSKHEVKRYHLFSGNPIYKLKDDELIDKLDFLFKQAIKRQWRKNKEYGYTDYAALSAGLDSRMTTWALSELENDIINITYSQTNYLDEKIPKQISSELRNHFIFKSLDNGLSLFNLDEMVKRNFGVVLYGGPAQVWDTFHLLNHTNLGVLHSGMFGAVLAGNYNECIENKKVFRIDAGNYSSFLIDRFKELFSDFKIENYSNQEIFILYNRGFNGNGMGAPFTLQEFTESYSPFGDVDFLEFCLTIPVEKRWNYNIYDKWVIERYPEAAKYAHNGRKISKYKGKNYNFFGKSFSSDNFGKRATDFLKRKIRSIESFMETPYHMNPFDYWYNTNNELRLYMDNYFNKNIELIENYNLKQDVSEMYSNGNTMEKTQVLTLLSIVNNFCLAEN